MNERQSDEYDLFSATYVACYKRLVRFANFYVNRIEDAEDITQSVFAQLWEQRERLSSIDNVNAFLYKSVRNRSLDFIKCKRREQERVASLQAILEAKSRSELQKQTVVSTITLEELRRSVVRTINVLPCRCKVVFLLSRMRKLNNQQIADRLGISLSTVQGQMHTALSRLKIALRQAQNVA